ncbi:MULTISPECIES: hypothetical protein [Prochlorococcus]|uniref:hypothetical protein n=1 Tax=Prochlorococcus TaxID=1218 RepID=UPI0005339FF8|nr:MULTISPECIES: hypothetical protein [Prochlorococcus]KGG11614.1 hypothetical protein EV05_1981 [Prochlorococcus sp. MIT 0601]
MVCGQCGDPLIKRSVVKPTQIFALIAATAMIAPFVFMVVSSLKNLNRRKPQNSNGTIAMILVAKRDPSDKLFGDNIESKG